MHANCQNKYKSRTMLAASREITQLGRGRRPNPTAAAIRDMETQNRLQRQHQSHKKGGTRTKKCVCIFQNSNLHLLFFARAAPPL